MDHQTTGNPSADPPVPPVPVGLEHLLCLAASHPGFADALIDRRDAVAEAAAVVLTPGERSMLRVVPGASLRKMIATVPVPDADRRGFLAHAALAVTALLGGTALAGCDQLTGSGREREEPPGPIKGIRPGARPRFEPDGAVPDAAPPPPRPRPMETTMPAGILVRPRPLERNVTDGIRPSGPGRTRGGDGDDRF